MSAYLACIIGGCLAAGLLTACGASSMHVPQAASGTSLLSSNDRVAQDSIARAPGRPWMAPDAKRQDLLYVTTLDHTDVYVYSYPAGQFEGRLTGFKATTAPCADGAGDVFVPDFTRSDVVEYAHGEAVPIATLSDEMYSQPMDCTVDPTTGNLAVANYVGGGPSGAGDVVVYPKARPPYKVYNVLDFGLVGYCSYDSEGNLFADNVPAFSPTALAELPKGRGTFVPISLPKRAKSSGGLQWDGKYLTISGPSLVYRLQIDGAIAHVAGTVPLTGSNGIAGYSIPNMPNGHAYTRLLGPDFNGGNVKIWKYPQGGDAIKTIGWLSDPFGAVVSPLSR